MMIAQKPIEHAVRRGSGASRRQIGGRRFSGTSRSGFSLIEIMVVLVVLLIGILAVVRLFPAGFLSISRTAETTVANALVQQQLDRQKSAVNQQEAIVAVPAPGTLFPDPSVLPLSLLDRAPGDPYLLGLDPYYYSNVNLIRSILGEAFRIPVPTTNTGSGFGAIYPLQFGPVENVMNGTSDSILVYGSSLQRTTQSSLPNLNNPTGVASLRNEAEYAIDYDNLKIAFYPRLVDPSRPGPLAQRQFTISYDYYVNNAGTINLQFQPNAFDPNAGINTLVTVPDVSPTSTGSLPTPVWQPLFNDATKYPSDPTFATLLTQGYVGMAVPLGGIYLGPPGAYPPQTNASFAYGISRDSEDVSRKFRLALPTNTVEGGGTPVWSANDPYEYAWYSKQNPGNTANPGILVLNPSGHNQPQIGAGGSQPLTARVDYKIFDNHVIRDDRNVPDAAPYIIPLSVPFLRLGGDVLDNQNPLNNFNPALITYNGIYRDALNTTPDIIVYDVNTGLQVGDWTQGGTPGTGVLTVDNTDPTPVDQKTGILTLNPGQVATQNLAGASLRIFYRTQRDWGMQVQKATAHYREAATPGAVDFRHYYIGDGTVGGATRIYFAPCDAGKSVILGEFYTNVSTQPNRNQTFQITEDSQLFEAVPGAPSPLPYIDITSTVSGAASLSATQTGRRVNNVQGCSVKSRVVWKDGLRWRRVDNDTVLVQSPAQ